MGRKYARGKGGRFAYTGGRKRRGGRSSRAKVYASDGTNRGFSRVTNSKKAARIAGRSGSPIKGVTGAKFVGGTEARVGKIGSRGSRRGASRVVSSSTSTYAPQGYIVTSN